MGDPIRFGVVGAGAFASRRRLPDMIANNDAEIVALCRRNESELDKIADHFEVSGRYTDYDTMLEKADLDAVLVATPHALHYEQTKLALERDLHVLLEKPMAIRTSEARELADFAAQRNRVLTVAVNPPFWRHTHYVRNVIQQGEIGDLEAVSFHWLGNAEYAFGRAPMPDQMPGVVKPTLYRSDPEMGGGGHLMDGGSHLISELLWVTQRTALSVSARMDDAVMDMRASVQVMLEGNVLAEIVNIGDSRHPDRRILNVYFGSQGSVKVEGMPFCITIDKVGESPIVVEEDDLPDVAGPVAHFVNVIRGKGDALSPPQHGVDVVQVMEGAYQSAKDGKRVDLV